MMLSSLLITRQRASLYKEKKSPLTGSRPAVQIVKLFFTALFYLDEEPNSLIMHIRVNLLLLYVAYIHLVTCEQVA